MSTTVWWKRPLLSASIATAAVLGASSPASANNAAECRSGEFDHLITEDYGRFFTNFGDCVEHVARGGSVALALNMQDPTPSLPGRIYVLWVVEAKCAEDANQRLEETYGPGVFGVPLWPSGDAGEPATHFISGWGMSFSDRIDVEGRLHDLIQNGCATRYWVDGYNVHGSHYTYDRLLDLLGLRRF